MTSVKQLALLIIVIQHPLNAVGQIILMNLFLWVNKGKLEH